MCCTFFGDVNLPSSRVFFDDSDDEDDHSSTETTSLEVKELVEGSLAGSCGLMIICEGNVARGFVQHHLLGDRAQKLAEISVVNAMSRSNDFPPPRPSEPCTFYKVNETVRVLDVPPIIDLLLANKLTILIESALRAADKILVLCNRSMADFRCATNSELPCAFLRILKSTSWVEPVTQRTVEQPNFISGLPASVISWCEVSDKSCLVTTCFTDTDRADSVTVDPFVKFFKSSDLSSLLLPVEGRHITYKIKSVSRQESNMYM